MPVIVPPAKTRVEVPGSSGAGGVRPVAGVRIVPASVSVPDGLLMTTRGRWPLAVVEAPGEGLGAVPLNRSVAVPPA